MFACETLILLQKYRMLRDLKWWSNELRNVDFFNVLLHELKLCVHFTLDICLWVLRFYAIIFWYLCSEPIR